MKFLESITFLGKDVLIPIDRIKYITFGSKGGYEIEIVSDDGEWHECFRDDLAKAFARYEAIKKLLNVR